MRELFIGGYLNNETERNKRTRGSAAAWKHARAGNAPVVKTETHYYYYYATNKEQQLVQSPHVTYSLCKWR